MDYKLIDANFLISASAISNSPSPDIAEVVFLGRSNVGKSSLLNTLVGQKSLAKASSTPGKTRLINFFDIKFKTKKESINKYNYARFVDLPGFGYAKVSKSIKRDWNANLTEFLQKRSSIRVFVHLIDSRHIDLEVDKQLNIFLQDLKQGDQIIIKAFTKIDKLKKNDLSKLKQKYKNEIFVSNLKKVGANLLQEKIAQYLFEGIV